MNTQKPTRLVYHISSLFHKTGYTEIGSDLLTECIPHPLTFINF